MNALGKFLGAVMGAITVLVIVAAGPAVAWWDRRPPGVLVFHVLFWSTPESLKTQRDAYKTAFATEQQSVHTLQAALDRQNAAVASLASSAHAWQRRSQQAVSNAAAATQWRLVTAAQIRRETLPADTTAAERCLASETLLRGAAR